MSEQNALAVAVGILGAVSTWLTAVVWDLPVWVLFLAWASFFFVGTGTSGYLRSVASNLAGIVIATITLLGADAAGGTPVVVAVAVGLGSFVMVQTPRLAVLGPAPAIVFGFAMTVGTSAATGTPITSTGIGNPALVAAVTVLVGAGFGIASELLASGLKRPVALRSGAEQA
ncbi:hypothetical protein GCM10022223_53630 [Kineosporia mesophila]|uniref:DUF1097 domain-containing protein n=1 Tax=Kineosporia mesophila TaxID=566012 RepID=A0ABP7ACF6_9ACTN|nr:DUF1097 domain-containing protein [Kineosporia mesophila]MCD5351256.1 DUF1097 domain-containing protein [Kineosporia mesophila]